MYAPGLYPSKAPSNDTDMSPASALFCKCTCFSESKIIELGGQSTSGDDSGNGHSTCLDCTKKFCLDYHLPICKDATEDDVFTTCFRMFLRRLLNGKLRRIERDSVKDEAVVFIFIFATVGLLIYAAAQPFAQKWIGVRCSQL
jgi:hypothetical protein